ncbi:serine/threonine protein kinase [bacterium]|nr:serine/threonine protein kinase [bacterium]MBP9809957.1 serine/threonine protein kinase [bacterium]
MVRPAGADFAPGDIVGNTYEVIDYIGRGAMGYVYHVRHTGLPKEYALKTLSPDQITETAWLRFQIEAQSIAKMFHPNIITIHNFAVHKAPGRVEQPFYVMDLLAGTSLMEELRDNDSLPLERALSVFTQAASGIGYAHSKGIVHRDIKPGNVMLLKQPDASGATVKIVDFGIAKLTADSDIAQQHLTSAGEVCGSPLYMSPEQGLGQAVDARSDVYSLGVSFFEALTGDLPFKANSAVDIMLLHQSAPVPKLNSIADGVEFPAVVQQVIEGMMAKDPNSRYQNMQEVVADLVAIQLGSPLPSSSSSSLASGVEHEAEALAGDADSDSQPVLEESGPVLPVVSTRPSRLMAQMAFLALSVAAAVISALAFLAIKSAGNQSSSPSPSPSPSSALAPKLPSRAQSQAVASVGSKAPNASSSSNSEAEKDEPKIDPEEDKEPGESLKETTPFATVRQVKGRKIVTFDFPNDALIGMIYSWNQDTGTEQIVKAKGRLKYDKGEWLCFIPSRIIAKYPHYLKRFSPGVLTGIRLNENSDSDQILDFCTIIPGIEYLELHRTKNLTNKCIASLNKFTELEEFDGYHSTIGGIALSRAECWAKIREFRYSHCPNVSPLLAKLKSSEKLTLLDVHESNLTYQDYKAISELTNLRELKFESDRMTLNELKLLANLPNLETIELYDCGLVEGAIPILRQFKALKVLRMETEKTTVKLRDKFKAGLPGVKIE